MLYPNAADLALQQSPNHNRRTGIGA